MAHLVVVYLCKYGLLATVDAIPEASLLALYWMNTSLLMKIPRYVSNQIFILMKQTTELKASLAIKHVSLLAMVCRQLSILQNKV